MSVLENENEDQLFNLVNIDQSRKKKIYIKLVDAEGEEVPFRQTVQKLQQYIGDKIEAHHESGEENPSPYVTQIMPLVSQVMAVGLPRIVGPQGAVLLVTSPLSQTAMIHMMMLSLSLYKLIKSEGWKIVNVEEDINDEEIEETMKRSQLNSMASLAQLLGVTPQQIMQELYKAGQISAEDMEVLGEEPDEDDDEDGFFNGEEE